MTSFIAECRAHFRTPLPYVVWAFVSVVVGIAGPFGSYDAIGFPTRLLFWSVLVAAAIAISFGIRHFVQRVLGLRDFRRGSVLVAALVCGLFTPPVYLLSDAVFGDTLARFPGLFEIAVFIFSVSLGIAAFQHAAAVPPAVDPVPEPRLLDRIDPGLRGDLISISVRDHYVDVQTSAGQSSLLLRFSDAIAEAASVEGAQVHRSHWVAWQAVTGVAREEGKLFLTLAQGGRIPVSRNHRSKLEARGLI